MLQVRVRIRFVLASEGASVSSDVGIGFWVKHRVRIRVTS